MVREKRGQEEQNYGDLCNSKRTSTPHSANGSSFCFISRELNGKRRVCFRACSPNNNGDPMCFWPSVRPERWFRGSNSWQKHPCISQVSSTTTRSLTHPEKKERKEDEEDKEEGKQDEGEDDYDDDDEDDKEKAEEEEEEEEEEET
ncbi:hypothetical protein PoB_006192700 [Plakobranchus ocellatus]|uniref:Uncharacterized protein n=1 Tax=Plakobranchus ocellatus TaxID=259542 RepID=A0AAV4CU54_9GAST|nr:hypothetical protein PoB_006192700 [Plakobranchus ocellatus]